MGLTCIDCHKYKPKLKITCRSFQKIKLNFLKKSVIAVSTTDSSLITLYLITSHNPFNMLSEATNITDDV